MYQTLHEARCSRCKRTYSSLSHPKIEGWSQAVFEDLGGNDYPYDPDVVELCKGCSMLAREFIENSTPIPVSSPDVEPLAAWERELLAPDLEAPLAVDGEALLDRLADILYPLDEYRDHEWNGGDVCDAVATILREYRPEAATRQALAPWPAEMVAFTEVSTLAHIPRDGTAYTLCGCTMDRMEPRIDGEPVCANCTRVASVHKHEWRWSNQLSNGGGITQRYCKECGVLFRDL